MTTAPTILVVDDNIAGLRATVRVLQQAGYEVAGAGDGETALRQVRVLRPSLVLLDVVLPDITGLEVLRQIRDDPKLHAVSVVLISSMRTNPEQLAEGLDTGADGYIARPIAISELLARVRLHLRQRDLTEQLRASQEQFSNAFTCAAIGMALTAPDGHYLKVNRALCQMLGYSEAELLARTFQDTTHPEDLQDPKEHWRTLMVGESESFQMEKRYLHQRGHVVWGHLSISLVRDDAGEVVHHIVQIKDITERKRLEHVLEEKQAASRKFSERLQALVVLNNDLSQIETLDDVCRMAIERGCSDLGFDRLGLWFAEGSNSIRGTWGTDENGNLRDERNCVIPIPLVPASEQIINGTVKVIADDNVVLFNDASEIVGQGCQARAGVWDGQNIIGNLGADNLIRQQPWTDEDSELLRLFAASLGHLCTRKRLERVHRADEERLRTLVDGLPNQVWITDTENCTILVNQAWVDFTGCLQDMAPRFDWCVAIHPDDKDGVMKSFLDAAAARMPYQAEYRIRSNGRYRWLHDIGTPNFSPDGTFAGYIRSGLDITDRKQTQETLLQSEQQFRAVFDNALDGIVISNDDGWFLEVNAAACEIYGIGREQLLNLRMSDFMETAADFAKVSLAFRAADHEKSEFYLLLLDGTRKYVDYAATANFLPGRHLTALRDITARKQAERSLQQAHDDLEIRVEERTAALAQTNTEMEKEIAERKRAETEVQRSQQELQSFIDAMSTLATKVAPDGTFLIINQIAIAASGASKEQIMKTNFLDGPWWTFDAAVQARVREMFHKAVSGTPINYDESIFVFGQKRTINFSLVPIRDAEGKVESLIIEGRDITELKNTETALQQAKAEAERANRAKSEFLSRMSHELRTPLNAILGFGQILDKQTLTSLQKESVRYILKGGQHLLGLINEVLDIARVEAGHIELSIEPTELWEIVQEACALVRPLAEQRSIRLDDNLAAQGQMHILADRQRFKQVLINLLSNAIKYNHPGGLVEVSCHESPNERIKIVVRDTGPGIPAEYLPKIFAPFERLDAANSDIEGTGLGLTLSQRLVNAMGGTLEADSIVGKGSTFSIELPIAQNSVRTQEILQTNSEVSGTVTSIQGRYTLLNIEDNISNVRLLEAVLSSRPEVTLLSAMQGSVGLDIARQQALDLILLDLHLPDITGIEILARLQQSAITRNIPVIVLSADATPSQIERLLGAGARAYLTKPLDIDEFLRTMDEMLRPTEEAPPRNQHE